MKKSVQIVITRVDRKTYKIILMSRTETTDVEYIGRMNLALRISELAHNLEPVDA
jgi:hypothetical protein